MPLSLPGRQRPTSQVISPYAWEVLKYAGAIGLGNGTTSTAWPAANRAIGYPFSLNEARVALSLFTYNGATAAGNIDVGVYRADGTKIVSIGTTAQSGTSTIQKYDIADTLLPAGEILYLMVSKDDTTGTIRAWLSEGTVAGLHGVGVVQMAAAFVLPSTITYAVPTTNLMPYAGVSFVSVY